MSDDEGDERPRPLPQPQPAPQPAPPGEPPSGITRITIALIGLAVFGALFAGVYYAPRNLQPREEGAPAFQLAPGEAKQSLLQPTIEGTPIVVRVEVTGSPIDLYVMEKDWSNVLPQQGSLVLDRPFSYYAEHSRFNLTGTHDLVLISDGVTEYLLVFDATDTYYANDTLPGAGPSAVELTTLYVEEQARSLVLGYIAAVPSVLLVVLTLGRKLSRLRRWKRLQVIQEWADKARLRKP